MKPTITHFLKYFFVFDISSDIKHGLDTLNSSDSIVREIKTTVFISRTPLCLKRKVVEASLIPKLRLLFCRVP